MKSILVDDYYVLSVVPYSSENHEPDYDREITIDLHGEGAERLLLQIVHSMWQDIENTKKKPGEQCEFFFVIRDEL